MRSFEIYGKWSVQTSIERYTHTWLDAVTLVWGLLRLVPTSVQTLFVNKAIGGV